MVFWRKFIVFFKKIFSFLTFSKSTYLGDSSKELEQMTILCLEIEQDNVVNIISRVSAPIINETTVTISLYNRLSGYDIIDCNIYINGELKNENITIQNKSCETLYDKISEEIKTISLKCAIKCLDGEILHGICVTKEIESASYISIMINESFLSLLPIEFDATVIGTEDKKFEG